jgi:formylglycine-generating enzyme required for sulfatase activity
MKLLHTLLVLLLISTTSYAQKGSTFAKQIESAYKPVGNTGYFASACECTIAEYKVFLAADKNALGKYSYDSTRWDFKPYFSDFNAYNVPLINVYYWHPVYQNYPINNITQEAANAYCEWLTNAYNADPKRKYKKVVFRLPTNKEWITAAIGNNPNKSIKKMFPWHGLTLRDEKGKYLANFAETGEYNIKRDSLGKLVLNDRSNTLGFNLGSDQYMFTAPCNSTYPANDFGLHNMSGNVAEYTNEMGKTKGGSFMSPAYYMMVDVYDAEFANMQNGGAFIGFRPFMFIIEK